MYSGLLAGLNDFGYYDYWLLTICVLCLILGMSGYLDIGMPGYPVIWTFRHPHIPTSADPDTWLLDTDKGDSEDDPPDVTA